MRCAPPTATRQFSKIIVVQPPRIPLEGAIMKRHLSPALWGTFDGTDTDQQPLRKGIRDRPID